MSEAATGGEAEILAARRRKLEALRAAGVDPFPYAYPGVVSIADVKAPHDDLAAGEETSERARVAGRIAARRGQGKAAFVDLVDRSGRMQLHARVDVLGEERMARLLAAAAAAHGSKRFDPLAQAAASAESEPMTARWASRSAARCRASCTARPSPSASTYHGWNLRR